MTSEIKISKRVEREIHQTKVVIRRCPPDYTEEKFLEKFSPLPPRNYFYFSPGDPELGPWGYSRAYINFIDESSIPSFRDQFDGMVLESEKGVKYRVVVEFAPFQGIPKKQRRKLDARCGTIEQDGDYRAFLKSREEKTAVLPPLDFETYMEELKANQVQEVQVTPLISYLRERKAAVKSKKKEVFVVEKRRKKGEKEKSSKEKSSYGKKSDVKETVKKRKKDEERVKSGKKFDGEENSERGSSQQKTERKGGERRGGEGGERRGGEGGGASVYRETRRGSSQTRQQDNETERKPKERGRGSSARKPDRQIYVPRSRDQSERYDSRSSRDSSKGSSRSKADINWPSNAESCEAGARKKQPSAEQSRHQSEQRFPGNDYSSGRAGEGRGRGRGGRGKGRGRGRGRGQYDYQDNTRSSNFN